MQVDVVQSVDQCWPAADLGDTTVVVVAVVDATVVAAAAVPVLVMMAVSPTAWSMAAAAACSVGYPVSPPSCQAVLRYS